MVRPSSTAVVEVKGEKEWCVQTWSVGYIYLPARQRPCLSRVVCVASVRMLSGLCVGVFWMDRMGGSCVSLIGRTLTDRQTLHYIARS